MNAWRDALKEFWSELGEEYYIGEEDDWEREVCVTCIYWQDIGDPEKDDYYPIMECCLPANKKCLEGLR